MQRRTFAQVLKDAKIDLLREYQRIYSMFNETNQYNTSLRDVCAQNFKKLPFKGTCITLADFDEFYGFYFELVPKNFEINYLINYCEYVYNLVEYNFTSCPNNVNISPHDIYIQIKNLIEKIGYIELKDNEVHVSIFVPKSQPAIVVSETLPPTLSYKVIEYNHHSMKGDLARKQLTLKLLADQLESQKTELKNINSQLQSDLFYLFNNLNIRHNNTDKITSITEAELETWYDKTYDLCLLAFMELENRNHKSDVLELKKKTGDV